MAIEFQKTTDFALDASYARNVVFNDISTLRLATLVVNRYDDFSDEIVRFGHTYQFGPTAGLFEDEDLRMPSTPSSIVDNQLVGNHEVREQVDLYPELADISSKDSC